MAKNSKPALGPVKNTDSFGDTLKSVKNAIWNFFPKKIKILIAVAALLFSGIIAILNFALPGWQEQTKNWFEPAKIQFGIYTFDNTHPISSKIQLIGKSGKKINEISTDRDGFVTFNIEKRKRIVKIQVINEGFDTASFIPNQRITSGDILKIYLDKQTLEFQRK